MTYVGLPETGTDLRLDAFSPFRMDQRARAMRAATVDSGGGATDPWSYPGWDAERTSHPCPPNPHSTGRRWLADPGASEAVHQ